MKIQKPSRMNELIQICDLEEILKILRLARQEEREIVELHIKSCFLIDEDISGNRFHNVIFENIKFNECNFINVHLLMWYL